MNITTPGSIQIKHSLPTKETRDDYDLYSPLNKNQMGKLVNSLITKGGPNAHESINSLAKTFFNKATDIGATTPLSDYDNDSEDRQAIIKEFSSKVDDI